MAKRAGVSLGGFRLFLMFILGWPSISSAEEPKYISIKNEPAGRQSIGIDKASSLPLQLIDSENDKRADSADKEYKTKTPLTGQDGSVSSPVNEVQRPESIRLPDYSGRNLPGSESNMIRRLDGLGTSSTTFISGGTASSREKIIESQDFKLTERLREGVRAELGEDVYEKAVWTYTEIKDMDNWVNSTMAQYGFGQGALSNKRNYSIMGLDGLVNVMAIFQANDGAGLLLVNDGNVFLNGGGVESKESLAENYQYKTVDGQMMDSRFSSIFRYFTIINVIYCFLGIVFISVIVKIFKFLVRQQ